MPASHQTARGSSAAASRGRRTQHRAHPRRGRRRPRRRPGGEHGRDRSPRGGGARDHLRALPDSRSAPGRRHRARARRNGRGHRRGRARARRHPPTRSRGWSAAAWRKLGRYHALVAINTSTQTPEQLRHRHGSVLGRLLPLVERGQAEGAFRADVPAGWHLSMLMALIHAGSARTARRASADRPKPRRRWWPPSSARSRVPGRSGPTRRSRPRHTGTRQVGWRSLRFRPRRA